jgi:crotonobetainyl-CoA:carnitine CoA-transferase CaiB-like acyl-CoA transferase
MAADEGLARNLDRVNRRDEVNAALKTAIAGRDRIELADALRAAGVPAGEVNTVPEILEDPHTNTRGMVGGFDADGYRSMRGVKTPARFSGYEPHRFEAPPGLGADTRRVLAEDIGLSGEQIEKLFEKGIVA